MGVAADLRILWHLLLTPIRGDTHSERLESFYKGQAVGYDNFRSRLLPGRQQLYGALPVPAGGRWIDMGGGTGSNLEHLADRLPQLAELFLVDLSPSLLEIARQRVAERRWSNVRICQADATSFQPPCESVDVVTFSYSLTMIPDWFAALEQASRLLKPGGWIGVVDFYVSRKHAGESLAQHNWMTRTFWPPWFAMDNVFLSADHLPALQRQFATEHLAEGRSPVPYLPLGRVPYYTFIGRKGELSM
jgi:S-adenosylmethionine-diacylgycerolhomoserine-N-methlytransferase